MKTATLVVAVLAFLAVSSVQADAIAVLNPGFTTPSYTGLNQDWDIQPDNWTYSRGAINGNYADFITRGGIGGYGSGQMALMQVWNAYSQFSQNLAASATAGATYTLSCKAGMWANNDSAPGADPANIYTFTVLAGTTPVLTLTGDVTTLSETGVVGGTWTQGGSALSLTSAAVPGSLAGQPLSIVLRVEGASAMIGVDDVALTMTPEPATMALLAFGGISLLRRRK